MFLSVFTLPLFLYGAKFAIHFNIIENRRYETAIRDLDCTGYLDAGKCQTDNFHKEGDNSLPYEWTRHSCCPDCFKKYYTLAIAPYKGDKACAISYTFDDGLAEQYSLVAPQFEKGDSGGHLLLMVLRLIAMAD